MKHKFLLKTMLLLSALIAGSGSAWADDVEWDLTTSSFSSSSTNLITWSSDYVTVTAAKNGGTNVNNYCPPSNAQTRLYNKNILKFSPASGYTVSYVEVTATSGSYLSGITGGTHSNCSSSSTNAVVTITPSNGSNDFQITLNNTVRLTKIKVYYSSGSGSTLEANDLSIPSTLSLDFGGTTSSQLTNNGVADGNITWQSNNTAVATVDASGNVTAVEIGTAIITATQAASSTYEGGSATCTVTVDDSRYTKSTLNFTAAYGEGPGTANDGNTWTVTSDGTESIFDNTSGIHYGTGSAEVTYLQLASSSNVGTIRKVVVNARDAQASAAITVTVGGSTSFTCGSSSSVTATNTSTDYVFNGNAKGEIIVRVDRGSSMLKAIYVKSIIVYYEPSTDPIISASDVDITYDATRGSIDYSLANATGTVSATVTTGSDWLTLDTITEDEVPFTCDANTGAERTATITLSFSGADDKVVTVTQAAAPVVYATIPDLFDAATSTAADVLVTFNNWVVSGVSTNGKNVFVTDNNGNGFVIYSSSDQSGTYAVGNILSGTDVLCSLKLNQGYAQLTSLDAADLSISTGGTVSTANITMASLAGVNTGALVSYENLICSTTTSNNNTYYYLSDGTTTLQVYNSLFAFGSTLENGHKYNIAGIYQQYGETKEILPRSADDIEEVFTPAISVTPASLTGFTYEVDNGPSTTQTISVSGTNLTADITLSLGENSNFEMSTTEGSGYTNSITLTQSEGAVAATTVYVRLKEGLVIGDSYSGTITLTSTDADDASVSLSGTVTAPVVDYATLPFSYTSGKSGISSTQGLTDGNLGSDYADSDSKLKFNDTGVSLTLKLNEAPGVVSFNIKGNSFSGGTFKVQGSANNNDDYEDLASYGEDDVTSSNVRMTITNIPSTVRYIKWIYTEKVTGGGNIGIGKIVVEKPTVTLNGSGYATYTSNSAIDYSQASDYTAWAITSIANNTITFSKVTSAVPAGTGVLLMGTPGQVVTPVATTSGTALETNLLEGITIATTIAADAYYGLSGSTFVKVNNGTVKAGKALLPKSVVEGSDVKAFTFVFEDDDATGVETIDNGQLTIDNEIYDLQGRRVQKPSKGLYIVNGKKVLF